MKTVSSKIKHVIRGAAPLLFLPTPALAVTAPTNLKEFAELAVRILQNIAGLFFVSLSVGLLFGVIVYFANSDNEQKRASIKGYLLWGVIGIIVVVGIWGILALLRASFGAVGVGIPQISPPTN